ncbi:MAG: SatD family protein [Desulfosarcinaceae bacterium]|nr:SatD family protein [Desulfosarcinaceae bacterium]
MPHQFILMGDIIASSGYPAADLRENFLTQIAACNRALASEIRSPYTVTLGDEFQGIAVSLRAVLDAIFFLEERLLGGQPFKLRYAVVHGEIDTPINRRKAHTMMGPGLTRARKLLTDKRRGQPRVRIDLTDRAVARQLERLFSVLDGITARWSADDAGLISDMIAIRHNAAVGARHGKNRSQIWKRRKHLLIEEYRALKAVVLELAAA